MRGIVRKHWSLISVIVVLWIILAVTVSLSLKHNDGHLIYALDDAYIHLAIAKNIVLYKNWGVTQYEFSSCSSSLLYPLLMAGTFLVSGVNEISPFILNIVFASLLLCAIYALLRYFKFPSWSIVILLLLTVFHTPLPAAVFTGMEHTLHMLAVIPYVFLSAKILTRDETSSVDRDVFSLAFLSTVMVMIRYESIFIILIIFIMFLLRRRYFLASVAGFFSVLPIVIYGIISVSKGWHFFPNSIMLKGNMPEISSLFDIVYLIGFYDALITLKSNMHFFVLLS